MMVLIVVLPQNGGETGIMTVRHQETINGKKADLRLSLKSLAS